MNVISPPIRFIRLVGWFWLLAILSTAFMTQTVRGDKISEEREALDSKEFSKERAAQRHGQVITAIWDELRKQSSNFPEVAKSFTPGTLTMPAELNYSSQWGSAFGKISQAQPGPPRSISGGSVARFLAGLRDGGWRLDESEFHHLAFESATSSAPASSTVNITLHASKKDTRVILRGKVDVTWSTASKDAAPKIATIDASRLTAWSRSGATPFRTMWEFRTKDINPDQTGRLLPLFVDDLDGDGLPEIALGGANIWLRNKGKFKFQSTSNLMSKPAGISSGFAVADFNGDGQADLLAAGLQDLTLKLHLGRSAANDGPGEPPFAAGIKCFDGKLAAPQCMAVADVDGDGDLDVFVGQYMAPYQGGNMPTPFYDANDGHPSFLLINDGQGKFQDITDSSGLAAKRNRRVYAASFVDFDGDSHLDLAVTSDFAGVDVYQGNGKGQFDDHTQAWLSQPHLFGMSHVLSDMNRDGLVDLFAVGMASTTARRLERMKLGLESEQEITAHRAAMGHGNRLYLANRKSNKTFALTEPEFADDVAESGWSWGAADPDLDNNGWRDIFIANGHISGKSACDYCSTFWRHDIYTDIRRKDGQEWSDYFKSQLGPLAEYKTSWNGFEHNVAFMQQENGEFTNLSYLLGLSHEGDSRAVVASDLDRDGDIDLIITVLDPEEKLTHRLIVYENLLPASADANWIGIDLGGVNAKTSPWNAKLTLTRQDDSVETAVVATGGTFCTQSPTSRHFGLGSDGSVKSVDVRWPNGTSVRLDDPVINQWHVVKPADK